MPVYCDVALPVPLDLVFTYRVPAGLEPLAGARVLVPFRQQRMTGVVVEVHDREPHAVGASKTKDLIEVLDTTPVLDEQRLKLARWIASYYIAPLGDVLRSMLPLQAEFAKHVSYRIAMDGELALHTASATGSAGRSRRSAEEQMIEFRVLDLLAQRDAGGEDAIREASLRRSTKATRELLAGMVRKHWITREDTSGVRTSARIRRVAFLLRLPDESERLNENQLRLINALAEAAGAGILEQQDAAADDREKPRTITGVPLDLLRTLELPPSTLHTLVRRGMVEIKEEPLDFRMSSLRPREHASLQLTDAQADALLHINAAVAEGKFHVCLLHGVTGSGKTAVYLSAMQAVLAAGRSAILLVPEIGLTPAAAADLHSLFGDQVAILHSGLSDDERAEQWHRIHSGGARIVVGTRSAVFSPVADLALIVVDEEHDSSYKQEETPRYHARDVAVMRAKMANATVVLGSATPSLESYANAQSGKYKLIELRERIAERLMPEVKIVDMRQEFQETGSEQVLSRALLAGIAARLARREQVMVLLNRRGYAPIVLCRACGHKMECVHCAISLTLHKHLRKMECHYCGFVAPVPKQCVQCGSDYVQFVGTGSEKLEEMLRQHFPQARIARMDRDTVRGRDAFEAMLHRLDLGEIDVLVGTQMIAKGHDFHGVTLVGVVGADYALGMPDFRAAERVFQLLTQVAGRAGRGDVRGEVLFQSYFPDHYAVTFAAQHDFASFYEKESRYRSWMHYPPHASLANVLVRSDKLEDALNFSGILGRWFEAQHKESVRVMGPAPAPIVRLKNDYRYHFVLKSSSREKLNQLLRGMIAHANAQKIPRTSVIVDVDALWLM